MNKKPQQGMNRISRLLPHLGITSDFGSHHENTPLLDGRNLRALTAHCVNLSGLINFFETAEAPFGTWGDILLLSPELAAACLLEEASCQEQIAGSDRPARITALMEDLSIAELERKRLTYILLQEELDWQNIWIERLKKTGISLSFPPFPEWPREQIKEQNINIKIDKNTGISSKAYWDDAALRIALRRSLLLESATKLWDDAISHPEGNLAPHVGMLLSFLERYSHLQHACNNLIPLYTSYFYDKVMGFSPRPAMADCVLACFNPPSDMPWSTVPTGSLLTMSNPPLTFTTKSSVPFSQTLLNELRAIIPTTLPSPFALSNVQLKEENKLWSLFKNVANFDSPTNSLVVGSTLFTLAGMELAEGLRKLIFYFELEPENNTAISKLKEAWEIRPTNFATVAISGEGEWLIPSTLSFYLSFPSDITDMPDTSTKEQIENEAKPLLIEIENKEDSNITNNKITKDNKDKDYNNITNVPVLIVSLMLEAYQSAILPPQEDIHNLTAVHPVMRFTPRLIESTLWQALNAFTIKNMSVDITVRGLKACELTIDGNIIQNPKEGAIAIFGTEPSNGSYFILTVPELAQKHIDSLSLCWQWEAPELFNIYFSAYPFKPISLISAMRDSNGVWNNFDAPIDFLGKLPQHLNCPLPESGKITSWRCSLSTEGSLFGQKEYPKLLAQAMLNESSIFRQFFANITGRIRLKELNPPLLPQWSAISLDYKASLHWDVNSTQIVAHEHPWAGVYPRHSLPPRLFPHYDSYSLSMEFTTGVEIEQEIPLSLYFCLQNLSPEGKGPAMSVHGADIWKDETNQLTRSGIIGMTPHVISSNENSSLNENIPKLFKVRFDWSDKPHLALQAIHEHAVWASYTPIDKNALNTRSFPLPLGSLATVGEVIAPKINKKELSHAFLGLKVSQPYPSIGGRAEGKLNMQSYYQDCAEQLLHRGQAILPHDFERLILREFPDILLALCIPHSSTDISGNFIENDTGSVSVVILSPPEGAKIYNNEIPEDIIFTLDPYLPPYVDAELMSKMTKYINRHSSPYATITLANPAYQKVNGEVHIYCDEMKNLAKAEQEIHIFLTEHIAPWAFEPSTAVFNQNLDISYLRGQLESFPWILNVNTFVLSKENEVETNSVSSHTASTNKDIIIAGIGSLFYAGELQITCIRRKEEHKEAHND